MYIIYDDFYLKHDTGTGHPENPGRLTSIMKALDNFEYRKNLKFKTPSEANNEMLNLVHDLKYIKNIEKFSRQGGFHQIDPDTIVSSDTFKCAKLAVGGCLDGIDLLFSGRDSIFFALVRPPGHHAFSDYGSGFCIFNNTSIAAKYAMAKYNLKKIAVIDFDVHHGNGTQNIFYRSSEVFYISIHQYPLYPGSGWYDEKGESKGLGFNLNIPVIPGSGEYDYIMAFTKIIFPIIMEFEPELFLISAGYDAHTDDPLASVNLTEDSYYKIMSVVMHMSIVKKQNNPGKKRIKTGIILEGGYNHKATALSILSTIKACIDAEKLMKGDVTSDVNKLIDLDELMEMPDNNDPCSNRLLAGNKDVFKIIERNAKI
jgi:acetoin utilization deacetylase AcuC-like enzyme